MKTETIEIRTPDGVASAYEVTPDGDGPHPGVLMCMDGLGLRDALRRIADRLGASGYHVLLPDMYYRLGRELHFDPKEVFGKPEKLAEMRARIGAMPTESVMRDTIAFLDALASRAGVDASRLGAIGFCMGGRFAFLTASHVGERLRAVAAIHPGGLVTPEPASPHTRAEQVKARVYVARASDDASFTDAQAETFDEALTRAGVLFQHERYAAKHGWAVDDTPVHDPAETERQWRAVLALFRAELGPDADA